eukprot:m.219310 g.219310  ORF g.219310 m.219310 type:complete len:60 (+) comp26283_c1_seq1:865-1044(+)
MLCEQVAPAIRKVSHRAEPITVQLVLIAYELSEMPCGSTDQMSRTSFYPLCFATTTTIA